MELAAIYHVTATKFGLAVYQKMELLTYDKYIEQCQYWNVRTIEALIARWNDQPESRITGLKWIYNLQNKIS